jgi:hypothetical protein
VISGIAIVTRIELTHHHRRRQLGPRPIDPIDYEFIMSQTADQTPNHCHQFVQQTRPLDAKVPLTSAYRLPVR